ncbi:xylulokinase [Megamonas hypermegale]|uniref:xylulokinase n=1 Tax=Megamonas hypermegale TaxID=158847 RepID=UPI0026F1F447|nr:FGGY family carbohydrate kinase [Megamonas hypermegale]
MLEKTDVLIGIDTGTSSTKISMFTIEGKWIRDVSFSQELLHPEQDQAEIDLNILFKNIMKYLKEIVTGYEDRIRGIGLSVASPTLVFFDHNFEALRPGIAYLDNRSIKEVEQAVERFGGSNMYFARVGNNPSPSTCVAGTINWIRNHEPQIWENTVKFGFLNSFIGVKLTGRLAVEPTVISYSGLVRVRKPFEWEPKFLEIFDIDSDYVPEIIASFEKLGGLKKEIADELNLPAGIPVAIGAADTAASSFAMGIRKHGDVFQSMGTSEVAVFCLNNPNFSPAFMNRSHVIPGLWLSNGAMSMAGGSIKWIINNIFPDIKTEQELEELANASPRGANGVMFLPYLSGERSPIFDTRASGVFFGITANTKKEDIVRAVYEGISAAMQQIYKIGSTRWGVEPEYIICIGGASKSKLSLQLRSDFQNIKICTVETNNAATFGAAMMGGLAAGIYEEIDDVPTINNYKDYIEPDFKNVVFYSKYHELYSELYPNLKELMHKQYSLCHDNFWK